MKIMPHRIPLFILEAPRTPKAICMVGPLDMNPDESDSLAATWKEADVENVCRIHKLIELSRPIWLPSQLESKKCWRSMVDFCFW